jgi:hypothetical protein
MENDNTLRGMKEKICELEQVVFLASKLVLKYEQILDRNLNTEWCEVREQILNESSKLKR